MRDKNVAGILALFFGYFGIHRFYLGQIGLGIFYALFFWFPVMWVVAFIDAIALFSMDQKVFDLKYNKEALAASERGYYNDRPQPREESRRPAAPERGRRPAEAPRQQAAATPYKQSGISKYKDFDYEGAIEDFKKSLEIAPKDIAVHFNIACAFSLTEQSERAFFHLDKAVAMGFNDFPRIKTHDAFAYLRIQPQFEEFERNGFRLVPQLDVPKADLLSSSPSDLLEQLKKLGELREKGLLTEAEFVAQKKKLLS